MANLFFTFTAEEEEEEEEEQENKNCPSAGNKKLKDPAAEKLEATEGTEQV